MPFSKLGLSDKVLAAVTAAGYPAPTPIQEQAIPHVLARRDVLGIAQTGTGKTAAFTLPMLTMLEQGRARARMPRTLILEPTRELAAQVEDSFDKYGKNHKLNVALIIGGVSFDDQDMKLMRGVDVLIATPGRLLDHFERGRLLLTGVELLVIDEADRMLDMGFIPDIERICKLVPFTRQTLFFTATMPNEIRRITEQFLHNPVKVEVARPATTAANITQKLVKAGRESHEKRDTLRRMIRSAENFKNAIIFCNRKSEVDIVAKSLKVHGFDAAPIHGDLDQAQRMKTLADFRAGDLKILVASDVAARGLDGEIDWFGSGLSGVLYVLDEPSAGLHPHDVTALQTARGVLTTHDRDRDDDVARTRGDPLGEVVVGHEAAGSHRLHGALADERVEITCPHRADLVTAPQLRRPEVRGLHPVARADVLLDDDDLSSLPRPVDRPDGEQGTDHGQRHTEQDQAQVAPRSDRSDLVLRGPGRPGRRGRRQLGAGSCGHRSGFP